MKNFIDLAENYILSNPLCSKHANNVRIRIRKFCEWFEVPPTADTITADQVNAFLVSLAGLCPSTINGYRSSIMAVWRFARGGDKIVQRIRREKLPDKLVETWSLDEVKRLLTTAEQLEGRLGNGVLRNVFWCASVHAAYSTGQRGGDLVRLPVDSIRADRVCRLIQNKTGKVVTVRFSEAAILWIRRHQQETVIPNCHTDKWFCADFRRLVKLAGVRKGTFRWLRRTSGSYVDAATGRGHELLGNTRAVFEKNYRCLDITGQEPLEPPEL